MKTLIILIGIGILIVVIPYTLKVIDEKDNAFPPPLKSLLIVYVDGTTEVVEGVTPKSIDGILYFYQNGERQERHDWKRWEKR